MGLVLGHKVVFVQNVHHCTSSLESIREEVWGGQSNGEGWGGLASRISSVPFLVTFSNGQVDI